MGLRILFFVLTLSVVSGAEWVHLNCYPHDCKVSSVESGLAPTLLGRADEALELKPGQKLLLERAGWKPLEYTLPVELGESIPADPIELEPDPAQKNAVLFYSFKQNWWKAAIPLVFLIGLGVAWKRKPGLDREAALSALQDEILERGPLTMHTLGSHRLLEPINEGGMAVVYRAVPEDTLDPAEALAVKVLKRIHGDDASYVKRWKREAQITSGLKHPNLVQVHGAGEDDGVQYIAMELLEGTSLGSLVRPGGIPWRDAVGYVLPVLSALEVVHASDVIHRDINPENIVLTQDNEVRVIDFGIARGEEFTRATKTGVVMGTVEYLAPEQLTGQLDPATDQYAVGVVLYELLLGQPPFLGEQMDVIMAHIGRQPPGLRDANSELPEELETVILRMLSKNPKERFANVVEASQALEDLL
jgi:predicted Ser/Thr protein kinase